MYSRRTTHRGWLDATPAYALPPRPYIPPPTGDELTDNPITPPSRGGFSAHIRHHPFDACWVFATRVLVIIAYNF